MIITWLVLTLKRNGCWWLQIDLKWNNFPFTCNIIFRTIKISQSSTVLGIKFKLTARLASRLNSCLAATATSFGFQSRTGQLFMWSTIIVLSLVVTLCSLFVFIKVPFTSLWWNCLHRHSFKYYIGIVKSILYLFIL